MTPHNSRHAPLPSAFANPPNAFRPWPFFVLNDEYLPGSGEARITELLESLARVGYGGVYSCRAKFPRQDGKNHLGLPEWRGT